MTGRAPGLALARLAALALLASSLTPAAAQVSPLAWPDGMTAAVQYAQPASGATVAFSAGRSVLFIDNGALLASLTVTLPASPVDGQGARIASAAGVTVLTIGGGTIKGAATSLAVNGWAQFNYSAAAAAWFRTG